ncbi:MAG: hypothetical protein E6G41_16480 [Actinobacteria bacterium]|nr:MAG: hypothetical protein E6G41_16480 [Actinomycetota bacterium]
MVVAVGAVAVVRRNGAIAAVVVGGLALGVVVGALVGQDGCGPEDERAAQRERGQQEDQSVHVTCNTAGA